MSWLMAIFVFLNAWWVVLFITLPLGIEPASKNPEPGMEYIAAPRRIHWRKIFIWNTALALGCTALLALVIESGIVPVREMIG